MRLMPIARPLIAAALGAAVCASAWAQELVSVRNANVNLRAEPNLQAEVLWKLTQGYPLRVLETRGNWLRVQDFEGDEGWIAGSVTARTPHHIVKGTSVNLRAEPNLQAEVLWKLTQGYPLQVLETRGNWLRVQDFEGDKGWIASSVTARTPHHIVKGTSINLRAGPGTQHAVVGKAVYGDVLRTARRQGDWVQVQQPNGGGTAWVASSLLWGW